MRKLNAFAVFVVAIAAASAFGNGPATAQGIRCQQDTQLNASGPVSSPYCEDEYLATIARTRGFRVTGSAIRASIATKRDVCRVLRHDSRVALNCARTLDQRRRGKHLFF